MNDIKAKIDEIIGKVKSDPNFAGEFSADPVGTVEKILGVKLPEEQLKAVIEGVKAKITASDLKDKAAGFLGKIGL